MGEQQRAVGKEKAEKVLTTYKRYKESSGDKAYPRRSLKIPPYFASKDLNKLIDSTKQDLKDLIIE